MICTARLGLLVLAICLVSTARAQVNSMVGNMNGSDLSTSLLHLALCFGTIQLPAIPLAVGKLGFSQVAF